jgi:predicted nucleic-acid-binding protein
MKGLDTNVLVRYLVKDDPAQFAIVERRLDLAADRKEQLLIAPVVLCELVWVLETAYGCKRAEIASTLEQILRTAQFEVLDKDIIWAAWDDYRNGKGDFADYYLGRQYEHAKAEKTLTFDKSLAHSPLFDVLG